MHVLSSPKFKRRRSVRYPVHLPVLAKLPGAPLPIVGRSENISLHGMLFLSDFLILERSAVELTINRLVWRRMYGLAEKRFKLEA